MTDAERTRLQQASNVGERLHFGLDASDEAIHAAREHPNRQTTRIGGQTCWWTPEERALIDDKVAASLEVGLDLSALTDDALRHFAGAVPDLTLPRGGWLVGFTDSESSYIEALRSGFRYPDRLVPFRATHTLAELEQVDDDIANADNEFRVRGLERSGSEIDVKRNLIVVGAVGVSGDIGAEALVERWLKERFGPVELLANVDIGIAPFSY